MKRLLFLCACSIAVAVTLFAFSSTNGQVRQPQSRPPQSRLPVNAHAPVLVELFTSQGCSSCPPADAVLAGLADRPDVVAISRHVTYWDRLGWRDTLGSEANTALQRAYAARGVAGGEVYTPEAVVNGRIGLVGSRASGVNAAIMAAASQNPVTLSFANGRISAPTTLPGAELRFIAVASSRIVRIGGGENGGRRIAYHNIVLAERSVMCGVDARCSATMPAALRATAGADRFAVVLQNRGHGAVLAARWMPTQ
ncbi:MAG: DUF1223 domain-containing protein [Pseudomonadota bacterium]